MFNNFEIDVDQLSVELNRAAHYFSQIERNEKEVDFNYVKQLIRTIDSKKEAIYNKYPKDQINKKSEKLKLITKQISQAIDNVIKHREAEKNSVALELEKLNNKKKIATYIR